MKSNERLQSDSGCEPRTGRRQSRKNTSENGAFYFVGVSAFTFTQLCEDQELSLSGVRLLLADGGCGAELNHVGMSGQLFLVSRRVKEQTAKMLPKQEEAIEDGRMSPR